MQRYYFFSPAFFLLEEQQQIGLAPYLYRPFVVYWLTKAAEEKYFSVQEQCGERAGFTAKDILEPHLRYQDFIQPGDTLLLSYGYIEYKKVDP